MKRLDIRIRGEVQGVSFRAAARDQALRLGLAGFARNEPDGSVYIEAEGEPAALEQLLAWCHAGPPGAKVESVSATGAQPAGHSGFDRI